MEKTLQQEVKKQGNCNLYEYNLKNVRIKDEKYEMKCRCGCSRIGVDILDVEEGWISIYCKRCYNSLYYHGA